MPPPPLRLPSVPLPYPEPSPRGRRPSSSSLRLARSRSAEDGSLGAGLASARRAGLAPMTPVGRPRQDDDAKAALEGSAVVWSVSEPDGGEGQADGPRTDGPRTEGARSEDPRLSPVWTGAPVTTVTMPSPRSPTTNMYGHERRASMLSTFSYHAPSPRASSDIEMVRKSTDSLGGAASERQVLFAGESFDAEDGVCEEPGLFEPPAQRELLAIVVSVTVLVVLSLAAGLTTVYDWVL